MLVWLARGAAGVFMLGMLVMTVNALVSGRWQFWVAAGALALVAAGWLGLGHHWRSVNGGSSLVLDATTGVLALATVVAFTAAAACLSTLGR